jgi:hypothetical protein
LFENNDLILCHGGSGGSSTRGNVTNASQVDSGALSLVLSPSPTRFDGYDAATSWWVVVSPLLVSYGTVLLLRGVYGVYELRVQVLEWYEDKCYTVGILDTVFCSRCLSVLCCRCFVGWIDWIDWIDLD